MEGRRRTAGSDVKQDAATLTTNASVTYKLKRTPVSTGKMFVGDGAKFWTDGKSTVLTGPHQPYDNCREQ